MKTVTGVTVTLSHFIILKRFKLKQIIIRVKENTHITVAAEHWTAQEGIGSATSRAHSTFPRVLKYETEELYHNPDVQLLHEFYEVFMCRSVFVVD